MCPRSTDRAADRSPRRRQQRGLSLVELLAVSTIMALIATGLAALASAVQNGNRANNSRQLVLQHARVTLDRLERTLRESHANEQFSGFAMFAETSGGNRFPDTLVVWHPGKSPADPDGLPRVDELAVFCPAPENPGLLLEIRVPRDGRTVPALANTSAWQAELRSLKSRPDATRVELTNLLRVARVTLADGAVFSNRGAIRFDVVQRPSAAQWSEFESGARAWEDISWVQDIYGARAGLCQSWCQFEFQLRPGEVLDNSADAASPFFGSGAVYFELSR